MDHLYTSLQRALPPPKLCRTVEEVRAGGIDLVDRAFSLLVQNPDVEEPFVIADYGCGSGTTVEQLARILEILRLRKGIRRTVRALGVDINPLPSLMRSDVLRLDTNTGAPVWWAGVWLDTLPLPSPRHLTEFVRSDISRLSLPDHSVDFGFSIGALVYVPDALRAIEHAMRVLRPGGSTVWVLGEHDISLSPAFMEILDDTPGAYEVFTYSLSSVHRGERFLIANKPHHNFRSFYGFPYVLERTVRTPPSDGDVPHAFYYVGAQYRRIHT